MNREPFENRPTTRTSPVRHGVGAALTLVVMLGSGCASSSASAGAGAANASDVASSGSFQPAQGATAYGVYLVSVASGNDPEAERVLAELRERGLEGGAGELGCDHGAPEALSLPPETIVVSVDFRTRDEATRFVSEWGRPVLGVAEIVAYCRD